MHQWNFSSVARGDSEWVVAVCGKCGLVRTQNAPGPAHERHIDLRGVCPGEPMEPESREVDKRIAGIEHEPVVASPDTAARLAGTGPRSSATRGAKADEGPVGD